MMAGPPGDDLFEQRLSGDNPTIMASRDTKLLYRKRWREGST
jgi:hypothetical protein